MENLDYTKELEAAKLEMAAILTSDNPPEHKYLALLLLDFDSAHQICLSAADGQSLNIRYLLTFFLAKNAMYGPMVDGVNFDTWPKTPGIRFNRFTRQSAKDLAWAFTAAVHNQFSSDPTYISFRLVDQSPPVCKTELQNWLDSVFSSLPNKLDLSDPERFNDDAKWLANAVIDEKKAFFDSKKLSVQSPEYSMPLGVKDWAAIFDVGKNKMRAMMNGEDYHFRQISPRKWTLPKNELPAEYLEKYRKATS